MTVLLCAREAYNNTVSGYSNYNKCGNSTKIKQIYKEVKLNFSQGSLLLNVYQLTYVCTKRTRHLSQTYYCITAKQLGIRCI